MRELSLFGARRKFEAFKMGIDRALLQQTEVRFGVGLFRNAARCLTPMIQNPRNVTYPRIAFAQAKHELEVLHSVEGGIEAYFNGKVALHTKQMTYIHGAAKIFRRPIRLEEGFD